MFQIEIETFNYLEKNIGNIKDSNACFFCGKSFTTVAVLKRNIHTVHEGHKDYKCESCGKSFASKQSLKNHIHTIHKGHNDYKCESCGKAFSQPGQLIFTST